MEFGIFNSLYTPHQAYDGVDDQWAVETQRLENEIDWTIAADKAGFKYSWVTEHHYGKMKGRKAILNWIQATMSEPLFSDMTEFPIDWYMVDEERGWIMCQVANVMDDPGDGSDHREYNWTLLHYAGDGRFSYEEDMYNPAEFGEMVKTWLKAKKAAAK